MISEEYEFIKCLFCGHTYSAKDAKEGKKECPNCGRMNDVEEGKDFARKDWI